MDTGYRYRSRNTGSAGGGRGRLIAVTVLVLFLFIIDIATGGKVRSLVRGGAAEVSLGFIHIADDISGSGYFSSHAALAAENQSLKAQVALLQERAALATALQAQVTALSSIDHLAQAGVGITAPVASSVIASPYGTFLIGAGSVQGVTPGSLVLSSEGTVVGTVSNVGSETSTVLELFAPQHSEDALLDGAPISIVGQGGGNATALVPHSLTVAVGDAVTAPEYGGRPVGVVGHFDTDPSSAATKVYIGSSANLASLQYVLVLPAPAAGTAAK